MKDIHNEEWSEEFRKIYYKDLEKDGIVAIDTTCTNVESYIAKEKEKSWNEALEEVLKQSGNCYTALQVESIIESLKK